MSEQIKVNLTRAAILASLLAGLAAVTAALYVSPERVLRIERRVDVVEAQLAINKELLIRIDENVKALKERRP